MTVKFKWTFAVRLKLQQVTQGFPGIKLSYDTH